jgi:RNA recognition motif-containing protein
MTLFVGNLFSQVTEANLRELLRKFARVRKIDIFSAAGFATVAIEGEANEERAVQELNGVKKFRQKLKLFKLALAKASDNPPNEQNLAKRPGYPPTPPDPKKPSRPKKVITLSCLTIPLPIFWNAYRIQFRAMG